MDNTIVNEPKGLSVASLLLGIASIVLGIVAGIFSIILSLFFPFLAPIVCCCVPFIMAAAGFALGIMGIKKEKQKAATFGLILSIFALLIIIGFVAVCFITPIVTGLAAGLAVALPFLDSLDVMLTSPVFYC